MYLKLSSYIIKQVLGETAGYIAARYIRLTGDSPLVYALTH
jgi:hypothetical protein